MNYWRGIYDLRRNMSLLRMKLADVHITSFRWV